MHERNGRASEISDRVFNALMRTTVPFADVGRAHLLGRGRLDPEGRDLDLECGYPDSNPPVQYYKALYERGGVAARAVNIWPDECWASFPELYQTDRKRTTSFERRWDELVESCLIWHFLHRADRLCGIGRCGMLLLGLSDGLDLSEPVRGVNPSTGKYPGTPPGNDLLYLRAFPEYNFTIDKIENDSSSPRFGQPYEYQVAFGDPLNPFGMDHSTVRRKVHWTRVIHLADNRESSEVYGVPRLRPVLTHVHDIRKVVGGAAEMFWKGGFPGLSFETWPDLSGEAAVDEESVRETVWAYQNGLQRYLTAVGGSWKDHAPQVADPGSHLDKLFTLLCSTIAVPTRVFLGSEAAHLASSQDSSTWKERLRGRQKNYLEPMVIKPFVNRLMDLGVLPRVRKYHTSWRDLQTLSDKDVSEVALKKTQALMQYSTGRVEDVLPLQMFLTLILGMTESEAEAVVVELKSRSDEDRFSRNLPAPAPKNARRASQPTGRTPGVLEE